VGGGGGGVFKKFLFAKIIILLGTNITFCLKKFSKFLLPEDLGGK
jgi:hypothetical protein